jgi:hypothetical protein
MSHLSLGWGIDGTTVFAVANMEGVRTPGQAAGYGQQDQKSAHGLPHGS